MRKVGKTLLVLLAGSLTGCGNDPEKLQAVGKKAATKFEKLLADAQERSRLRWEDSAAPDYRVYSRLKWDKELNKTKLKIQAKGSTVTLSGSVQNGTQKTRAIELAKETAGVEKVVDEIEIVDK